MQLRTVCDKHTLQVPIIFGNFEAKISIDIQQTLYAREMSTHFDRLGTKLLVDFLQLFDMPFQKKHKKSCFLKCEKT